LPNNWSRLGLPGGLDGWEQLSQHAYSRFLAVREGLEAALPTRGGKTRPLSKEDFSGKSAIYLKPEAQFDYLASLKEGESRAQAIIAAMNSIEADYTNLRGVLPKIEYFEIENDVLGPNKGRYVNNLCP
jgi:type I restriction enzyme M protein